jgi:iron complex outermembrane recepter protein
VSITPFVRWNSMEILPNWTLTFDPGIWKTGHSSIGALLKTRHDFGTLGIRAIAGLDVDYSPGSHEEWRIQPQRTGTTFTSYTRGDVTYDYNVTFVSTSPYVQLEMSPVRAVHVVAGLRYDLLGYSYDNPLGALQTGSYRRPASGDVDFSHLSPKLGIAWAPFDLFHVFGSYSHGFRAPSEGQLFRQGRALSTIDLAAVRADNLEAGIGGTVANRLNYQLSVYEMRKTDDLLTFTHPDGSQETVNAGETSHRGVEGGLGLALPHGLRLDANFSHASHSYEEWLTRAGTDFSGKHMEAAPERTALLALTWLPARWHGASASIEGTHVGPYWMDPENTQRYDGHVVVAVRAETPISRRFTAFGRITNALDERYAELASYTTARGAEYAPGMPRALYFGLRYQ